MSSAAALDVHPLTAERWADLEQLFGPSGACAGCWCMWWRGSRAEFERNKGDGNRRALRRLVAAGGVPGLLAYRGGRPVGWVAVEPRERYEALDRSRILAAVDEQPVWSVTCFFVVRGERGRGVAGRLLAAAVEHVRRQGGELVEGYPVDKPEASPAAFVWTGPAAVFRHLGFQEVARRSPTRPVMRLRLAGAAASP